MKTVFNFLGSIGAYTIMMCVIVGRVTLFAFHSIYHIVRPPIYGREILNQFMQIGYYSLPVVGLTALFTGAALALQIYSGGQRLNAESVVPSIVAIGMVRELGPVLGGLIVTGRISSSIAAELGTMRVSEQIDALITLSTNPMKYLIAPRLIATTLSLPLLVALGDIIGIMGGYLVATKQLGFNTSSYLNNTINFLEMNDITTGMIKAVGFGFIIALMGCYHGYHSQRGAQGVGKATTNAVVSASVLILTFNYILTEAFF